MQLLVAFVFRLRFYWSFQGNLSHLLRLFISIGIRRHNFSCYGALLEKRAWLNAWAGLQKSIYLFSSEKIFADKSIQLENLRETTKGERASSVHFNIFLSDKFELCTYWHSSGITCFFLLHENSTESCY